MCMDCCYMTELMLYESSNVKELHDPTTEAQQSKSFAAVNSAMFNNVIQPLKNTCVLVQF